MKGYIYRIINTITGDFYIGSTCYPNKRKISHLYLLRNNKHNIKIQRSYNKYGNDVFKFEILEELECSSKELILKEQEYYDKLSPFFNMIRPEESSNRGRPMSEKQKIKISEAKKGKPSHNKGKSMSKEQKEKISKSNKKFYNTVEGRKILRDVTSLRKFGEEWRKKLSDSHKRYFIDKKIKEIGEKLLIEECITLTYIMKERNVRSIHTVEVCNDNYIELINTIESKNDKDCKFIGWIKDKC